MRRRRYAEGDLVEDEDTGEGLGAIGSPYASTARSSASIRGENLDEMSFKEAYKRKAKELGEGKVFEWRGNKYLIDTGKAKPKTEADLPKAAPPSRSAPPAARPVSATVAAPVAPEEESFGTRFREGALGLAERGMRATGVPLHYRTFLTTLAGSKRPITEENLTQEEKDKVDRAIKRARKAGRNYITYADYDKELLINKPEQFSKEQDVQQTIGRAPIKKDKSGRDVVEDIYDFMNAVRAKDVRRYQDIRKKEGRTGLAKEVARESLEDIKKAGSLSEGAKTAFNKLPSRIGNAFIGEDGRPVRIQMRKGGAVKSTASSRGDGIARKGKTRGRFV